MVRNRTCKRRKVRLNSDGSLNQDDLEYNRKCEEKYMLIDNPWMKSILKKKKPKGYDKYLKNIIKNKIKTKKINKLRIRKSSKRKTSKKITRKGRKRTKRTKTKM